MSRPTPPARRIGWHYDKYFLEQWAKRKQGGNTR